MEPTTGLSRLGVGPLGQYYPQGGTPYRETAPGRLYPRDFAPPDPRPSVSELSAPVPVARAGRPAGGAAYSVDPLDFFGASYAAPAGEAAKAYSWWQTRFGWAPVPLEQMAAGKRETIAAVDTSKGSERPMYLVFAGAAPEHFGSNSPMRWLQGPVSSPGWLDWAAVGEEIRHSVTATEGAARPPSVDAFAKAASAGRLGSAGVSSYRLSSLDEAIVGIGTIKAGLARQNSGVPVSAAAASEAMDKYLSLGANEYREQPLPVDLRREFDFLRDADPRDRDSLLFLYRALYDGVVRAGQDETLPTA